MKKFTIPTTYRSRLITGIKEKRKNADKLKKDFTPTLLDFGQLQIILARHFGFCYGVENAIEIAFRTIEENPGKNIFLLSDMIHNPSVNADLKQLGVRFLQDNLGNTLIPLEQLHAEDIVITPAFGTTVAMENLLKSMGIAIEQYDTTCPFVEKVWNRSEQIGKKDYTIIVHGKPIHEETRATFSHAAQNSPTLVINDMEEAKLLADYIRGINPATQFYEDFKGRYSEGFDVNVHLQRIGVVNQTTMLASDTQGIADFLKQTIASHHQLEADQVTDRFADTRDTLCYATNDNQTAVQGMLEMEADLAIVMGGYNSSNTSHLVELCELQLPTYYIDHPDKIISEKEISHFDFHHKQVLHTSNYLPAKDQVRIMITSGASCPDALVEALIQKLAMFYTDEQQYKKVVDCFLELKGQ